MSLHFEILANKGHRFLFNRLVDTLPVKGHASHYLFMNFNTVILRIVSLAWLSVLIVSLFLLEFDHY